VIIPLITQIAKPTIYCFGPVISSEYAMQKLKLIKSP